jgi:uncharacterized protein YkuJ
MSDSRKFAKLFERDGKQVLVKIDVNDEGNPEVRFYVQPDGLGVCSIAYQQDDDSDASWARAEKSFDEEVTEEKAWEVAEKICAAAKGL